MNDESLLTEQEANRERHIRKQLRGVRLRASVAVLVFFGIFGAISATAELDSVAIGTGSTVVESNRKKIQHLEGGIVAKILKRDGDVVKTGEPLLILDDTRARVAFDVLSNLFWSEAVLHERLTAERDKRPMASLEQIVAGRVPHEKVRSIYESQTRILKSRRQWLEGNLEILTQGVKQREERIVGLRKVIESERTENGLIKEEIDVVAKLLTKGLTQKPRLLALQRRQAQIEGQIASNLAEIARIEQEIGETKLKIIQFEKDNAKEVLGELRDTEKRLEELRERLKDTEDVFQRTIIRAPQSGTVVSSIVYAPGQVIRPGELLMELVPTSDKMIVEAKIDPRDIEYVAQNARAKLRFIGLPRRTTPTIVGSVIYVSADSIQENNQTFYRVRVAVGPSEIRRLGEVTISPGMPVEVMVIAGRRTLLDYIISPILSVTEKGLRERH